MQTPRLQFSRDGRLLISAMADGIAVVSAISGEVTRWLPVPGVIAVAGFAEQIWALDADGITIRRWTVDGRSIAGAVTLEASTGWAVAPTGVPAVVLEGGRRVAMSEDVGALVESRLPAAGVIIPVSGRRQIHCDGRLVRLGGGVHCFLGEGVQALAGAALFDGAAAMLVVERAGAAERSACVLSMSNARLQQRVGLPDGPIRVATRRGYAVIRTGARTLTVLDLRLGRHLGCFDAELDIEDFAVDADARQVALWSGHTLQLRGFHDWTQEPAQRVELAIPVEAVVGSEHDAEPATAAVSVPDTVPEAAPPIAVAPLAGPFDLVALAPRRHQVTNDREQATALLDRELRTVALRALLTVARGWDTRRIGFPSESEHPFEMEVAAILGMNHGHAAEHLAAARQHLAAHLGELASDPQWRAVSTPVGALAAELGLSSLGLDILMTVAAPALWGDVARIFGVIANDPGRPLVDELLVHHLLGGTLGTRHDVTRELDPGAPLVRLGLIQVASNRPRPFAALSVDPVVLSRLRCEAAEPGVGAATRIRVATKPLAALQVPREVIHKALRYLSRVPRDGQPVRLTVRGRAGSGRRSLVAALAAEAGRDVGLVDATLLPRQKDAFIAAMERELRRANLRGLVPCVCRLDDVTFEEQGARDLVLEVFRVHPGPLALCQAPGATAPFDPGHLVLDLPVLPEADRLATWQAELAARGLWVRSPDALAARYRVGPGVIYSAIAAVAEARADDGADRVGGADDDATDELDDVIRQTREFSIGGQARRVERLGSWSSLVLPPDITDSLRELIGRIEHRRTVYERWGFGRTMATSRGLTALFQGPPGTGKTMVAGIIARELGLDLYQVDLSKVMSKWLGETERNLAAIFDAAEDGQVVLLFDEADSLFAKRTEVKSSHDRYANLEVNYLLQRLDSFEGIAVLTTNFGGSIDPAFKRRLSFRLSFPFPDEETREELWRVHLPPELPTAGPLDLAALSRKYQLTGGYIRNACVRAAFLAAQSQSALNQHHLERAVALEFAEVGKLSSTGPLE